MRLWSIQTLDVWHVLQQEGVFRPTAAGMQQKSFEAPYRWMTEQLARRVQPPPAGCAWPIWAWYQWSGRTQPKPDLRAAAHLPKGTLGVRLEIDLDPAAILLSDFELWHYVLNYWYLPASEADSIAFEHVVTQHGLSWYETQPLPEPYHSTIAASWERIFDLDWEDEDFAHARADKSIQAVFWELSIHQVKRATTFTAR